MRSNSFDGLNRSSVDDRTHEIERMKGFGRLPSCLKVPGEHPLRNEGVRLAAVERFTAFGDRDLHSEVNTETQETPARVPMQDFTGVSPRHGGILPYVLHRPQKRRRRLHVNPTEPEVR